MNRPIACIFDAFGTLFKVKMPLEELDQVSGGKGKEILELWRSRQLEYTWLRALMGNWVDFDQVTHDALVYTMKVLGTEDPRIPELLMPIYRSPQCFDDVTSFLHFLKDQKIKIAILSNGTPEMLNQGVEHAGLLQTVDHILSVNEVATFKVNPVVYQMALDQIGVSAEETIFFSSNAWDISGASYFGLPTIWVNRSSQPFEELGVQPDHIVQGLSEAENLIRATN